VSCCSLSVFRVGCKNQGSSLSLSSDDSSHFSKLLEGSDNTL
jgi:hypothetical protein